MSHDTTAPRCEFCEGAHAWEQCPTVFKPIKECEFSQPEDGCCSHPKNMTPECEIDALIELTPTHHFTQADFEREGIRDWQDWLARIISAAEERCAQPEELTI